MTVAPVVRAARVERTPSAAFRIFTDEIGAWWPLPTHSTFGDRSGGLAFVDGRLVEMSITGDEAVWGNVTVWEPGSRLVFSWHPGQSNDVASEVEVSFQADGEGTRVVVEHRGWEAFGADAAARRNGYTGPSAWGHVLDHLAVGTECGLDRSDLAGLVEAADRFFREAESDDFGRPADGEWTAEEVVAHVTLNDASMLAVCHAIAEGREGRFDNAIAQNREHLGAWVTRQHDMQRLVAAGRRVSSHLVGALSMLSPEQLEQEVPCRLVDGGELRLDGLRPWGAIAIEVHSTIHLPAHTEQLAGLRVRR
ncbi:MAG: SRPBCC domain-containing protein [Ilumatobacter sp.]